MLPVGDDADALEALHLTVDVFLRKLLAGHAELGNGHGLVVELVLLDDGRLDGHTVVVPTGNERRVVAAHRIQAHDEVLQRLVERVAHVDVAVGERRAVMQGKTGLALVLFQQLAVNVELLPRLQHGRLALRKTRAHRETGFVHVQCLFVFHLDPPNEV